MGRPDVWSHTTLRVSGRALALWPEESRLPPPGVGGLIRSAEVLNKTGQTRELPLLTASDLKHCGFLPLDSNRSISPSGSRVSSLPAAAPAVAPLALPGLRSADCQSRRLSASESVAATSSQLISFCACTHSRLVLLLWGTLRDQATGPKTKKKKAEEKCNHLRFSYWNVQI